jgi:hypothetical protein
VPSRPIFNLPAGLPYNAQFLIAAAMSNFKRASQYGQPTAAPKGSILSALQATSMLDTRANLPAGKCREPPGGS